MPSRFLFNEHDRIACIAFDFFRFLLDYYAFALHVNEAVLGDCFRFLNHYLMQSHCQLLVVARIQGL